MTMPTVTTVDVSELAIDDLREAERGRGIHRRDAGNRRELPFYW